MRLRTLVVLALPLTLLHGDNPAPAEAQLVDLSVVALDSHNQPVTDLTRADFQVTDAGKPQKIEFFRRHDAGLWQAPTLGRNEFSNRGRTNIPRATVMVFDLLNERFATRGTAANQLTHYLQSLESADYLYLYLVTVEGRLVPVHGLPGPEDAPSQPAEGPWTKQIKPLLDAALRAVVRVRPPDIDVAVRVQLTYGFLETMAAELSRIPGRKNIVWITDGVPISLGPMRSDTGDFVDFTPLLRRLSSDLDRSEIAIYPVREVMMGSPDAMGAPREDAMSGGNTPGRGPAAGNLTGLGSAATLDEFAGMTGGRPDAGKDISGAVTQALQDAKTAYRIGYYPPARNWDSKFHKLRVTCTRKGVRLQTKTGYYAWPEPPQARVNQAINAAAAASFDAAEIGLKAALSTDPKNPHSARIEARIDAQDLALAHDGDQYRGQLWLALLTYTGGRPPEISRSLTLDLGFTPQQRDQALRDGVPFAQDVTIDDAVTAIRLIVFDRGSDTIGSVTAPIQPAGAQPR